MVAKNAMSKEHKAALAEGRARGRAVRAYLEALEERKPKRGRRRTPDSIRTRLNKIDELEAGASVMRRLELVQERKDLAAELETLESASEVDLEALEAEFVEHAAAYGEAKGIEYATWREFGVDANVLKTAGIGR